MIKIHPGYFTLATVLFLIEVYIALFVRDQFIRPYFGDFLVVILLYCIIKSFFTVSVTQAAIAVLLFAYTVETLQYLNIVQVLGLQNYKLARIVIGTSFAWEDILVYTGGVAVVVLVERNRL